MLNYVGKIAENCIAFSKDDLCRHFACLENAKDEQDAHPTKRLNSSSNYAIPKMYCQALNDTLDS
jgi:hypothetical protein